MNQHEREIQDRMGEQILEMMYNKEEMVSNMFQDASECLKIAEGCMKMAVALKNTKDGDHSVANLAHQTMNSLVSCSKLARMMKDVLLIQAIYFSGSTGTTDLAQAANRLGKGQEALASMLQSKLRGES